MYRSLRDTAPVAPVRTPTGDIAWLVTGHAEAKELFADRRLGRSHPAPERAARISDSAVLGGPMGEAGTEAETHEQARRLLAPAFSARRMRALQERVAEFTGDLLDRLAEQERPADLHEALSFPLPVLVICELLGVPYADREEFGLWSRQASNLHDREASTAALQRLNAYMRELVAEKRVTPGQDVISDLVAAQAQGGYDDHHIAGLAALLLFAGHETTVARIDVGTLLLLTNPEQCAAIRRDPALVDGAVEEILRMAVPSSNAGLPRYAHADIEVAGVHIRTGDAVVLSPGAANRDPEVFDDPDAFDIRRVTNPHLAFGYGAHYCLAASLARVELRTVFTELPRRFPALALAVPVQELPSRADLLVGGLTMLPVTW